MLPGPGEGSWVVWHGGGRGKQLGGLALGRCGWVAGWTGPGEVGVGSWVDWPWGGGGGQLGGLAPGKEAGWCGMGGGQSQYSFK